MFKGLFKTMMQAHDLRHLDKESKARTITIPTGAITSTNFELTIEEKSGYTILVITPQISFTIMEFQTIY